MADPPVRQFEVTGQHIATDLDADGKPMEHYHVGFITPSGDRSHIKVKREHYTARNVHDLISQEAKRMEMVRSLGMGEPPPHEHEQPIEP